MNIIGDIGGQFDALQRLLKKMPQNEQIVLVGDLNDRGPKSREVIEWAMNTPNVVTLQSNHGHMMVDYFKDTRIYGRGIWAMNGGDQTLDSYGSKKNVPESHIEWLNTRPIFYRKKGLFISHAAWANVSLREACNIKNDRDFDYGHSIIWSRLGPKKRKGLVQICGHNSHWGLKYFGAKSNPWAVCIDDSGKGKLTGIHWPSMKVYQESVIEKIKKK